MESACPSTLPTINSDGSVQSTVIDKNKLSDTYIDLAIEYELKKQEEKEDARRIKEELREQQKLEQRKEQILNEIAEKKARLESEKKKEKSVLKQIDQQKGLIALRQKLLNTTAKQTRMLWLPAQPIPFSPTWR